MDDKIWNGAEDSNPAIGATESKLQVLYRNLETKLPTLGQEIVSSLKNR